MCSLWAIGFVGTLMALMLVSPPELVLQKTKEALQPNEEDTDE